MRQSFFGAPLSDSYPTKQLYNRGNQLVVHNGPKSRVNSISELINSPAGRIVATAISDRIKGGNPNVDIENEPTPKSRSKGKGRGRGNGSGNSNPGNNNSRKSSFGASSDTTRGYQVQQGVSCLLFSSGVSSGLTVCTRIVNKDYTPLYLSSGNLFLVTDQNINRRTPFIEQLNNVIYPLIESNISNKIQRYAGRYISSDDFEKYILSLVKALQIYYCIDSTLTYCSNNTIHNINIGMEHLRSQFSATTLVEFNLLRETLETCNCPHNLLSYIRFLCQNYRLSDAPHSPIIKLNIAGIHDPEWILGTEYITDLLQTCRLDLISKNKMVSYLNQTYPNWVIRSMPISSNEACFNKEFFTFWHNQNFTYLSTKSSNNGNFEYSINVANQDSYTDYQIIQDADDVDGVMFVSQTYNILVDNKREYTSYWGAWQPLATLDDKNTRPGDSRYTFNLKCFTLSGKIESCTDATMLGASGAYNLVEYSGTPGNYTANLNKFGAYGFVKLQNVSVRMQTEAFNNSMRFWFMGE